MVIKKIFSTQKVSLFLYISKKNLIYGLLEVFINIFKTSMCILTRTHEMEKFKNVNDLVNKLTGRTSLLCPSESIKTAANFLKIIFGKILYAVKTNPNEFVI